MRGEFAPGLASRDLIKDINLEVREGQARVTDNPPYAEFNRLSNERRLMPLAERTEEPVEVPVEAAPVEMQVTPPVAANPAPTVPAAAPVQQADTGVQQVHSVYTTRGLPQHGHRSKTWDGTVDLASQRRDSLYILLIGNPAFESGFTLPRPSYYPTPRLPSTVLSERHQDRAP